MALAASTSSYSSSLVSSSSSSSSSSSRAPASIQTALDNKNVILKRHREAYASKIMSDSSGAINVRDLALVIAEYVADGELMDRAGWKEYFGIDIGEETPEVQVALSFERFYRVYHGPNPVDVMNKADKVRQVCESCLIPVVIPERFTYLDGTRSCFFSLRTLGVLAQHPTKGHAAKYWQETDALKQHWQTRVKRSCVVICLQEVVARGASWSEQFTYLHDLNKATNYGCEVEPDALSQNTALFAHHVVTGKRPFSDGKEGGMEDQMTFGRTRELVQNQHMVSGGFEAGTIGPLEGSAPAELDVYDISFDHEHYGVGVLRKFS